MAKLPEDFEKSYLELIDEYRSEQATKLKRNIDFLSFAIISGYITGIDINNVKIFGADIKAANKELLILIVICLLLFWMVMLAAHLYKDEKYNQERKGSSPVS